MWADVIYKLKKHQFLFEELVKRDFKKKYKRTSLGMIWSVLSPLLMLLVMSVVFTKFFGNSTPHFTIYLFSGWIVFNYFTDATNGGMQSLVTNAAVFTKVNVPKYLFLLSRNVSSAINFGIILCVYFIFVAIDGIGFTWKMLLLVYPIACLIVFNIGMGLILSALFVIFKDIQYLYSIFTQIVMYLSAIFYPATAFGNLLPLFYCNPIYCYITYFRWVVIYDTVPSIQFHALCAFYAVFVAFIGATIYKKYNYKFLYYV